MQNIKNIILYLSSFAIIVASIGYYFNEDIFAWLMVAGVVPFSICLLMSPYPGKSIRGRRLFSFQIVGCALLGACAYLMIIKNNNCILALLLSSFFIFYSNTMMSKEYKKETKNNHQK